MTRGRPRGFDVEATLETVMRVFWEHGYEGASMAELTERTRVRRGSLYQAFGTKEELFDRALARYQASAGSFVGRALAQPTAAGVAETVLRGIVETATGDDTPRGCLFVHGALGTSPEAEPIRERLADMRAGGEALLATRFAELAAEGDPIAVACDPKLLAGHLVSMRYGLAVQARSGATRERLHALVDLALAHPPLAAGRSQTARAAPTARPATVPPLG